MLDSFLIGAALIAGSFAWVLVLAAILTRGRVGPARRDLMATAALVALWGAVCAGFSAL